MFGKKKNVKQIGTSYDHLLLYTYKKSETIDDQFEDLALTIMNNRPVAVNFENILVGTEINRVVAFLSGVTYALYGSVYQIGPKTFLFASKVALEDGTIKQYIGDVGK